MVLAQDTGFDLNTIRFVMDGILTLGFCVVSYVGVQIKQSVNEIRLEQLAVKGALTEQQGIVKEQLLQVNMKLKEEFTGKVADISQTFAVHAAEDHIHFDNIRAALSSVERSIKIFSEEMTKDGVHYDSLKDQLSRIQDTLDKRPATIKPKSTRRV